MNALEAIRFVQGKPAYSTTHDNPGDIEHQRHPVFPGEISTHLRYGSSVKTRGQPDAYSHSQRIRPLKGLAGPIPARQDLAGDDNQTSLLHIYTAFRRPHDLKSELLDQVKQLGFDGADKMVEDAAAYLADVAKYTHFDAVSPVPSSKPLAHQLAQAVAARLDKPLWLGSWSKLAAAKDSAAARRGTEELFKSANVLVPDSILLVDDFVTTRQSITELARKLYSMGARYVAAVALCGPATPTTAKKIPTP